MKVKELIEELQGFDSDATIKFATSSAAELEILSIYDEGQKFIGSLEQTIKQMQEGRLKVWIDIG